MIWCLKFEIIICSETFFRTMQFFPKSYSVYNIKKKKICDCFAGFGMESISMERQTNWIECASRPVKSGKNYKEKFFAAISFFICFLMLRNIFSHTLQSSQKLCKWKRKISRKLVYKREAGVTRLWCQKARVELERRQTGEDWRHNNITIVFVC